MGHFSEKMSPPLSDEVHPGYREPLGPHCIGGYAGGEGACGDGGEYMSHVSRVRVPSLANAGQYWST